jgi:pimeloyl-ACP methyl ester carboxylesterase
MVVVDRLVRWASVALLERFLSRKCVETTFNELWINSTIGPSIYAHIHRPAACGEYPGVVFVPGGLSCGLDYDGRTEVTADEVASLGFAVLHYDPSGRGRTGGEEDYWGLKHQEELAIVLDHLSKTPGVRSDNISVFSFSIGITISSGTLARFRPPYVKRLFDWEGPSNRFNITKNDAHKPLKGFPSSNLEFWKDREAARYIGEIECGYFRYQAQRDHVQGTYKGHAIELINLATKGEAKWTRLNDNPPNTVFDQERVKDYRWAPSYGNLKGRLLKYFLEIQALE